MKALSKQKWLEFIDGMIEGDSGEVIGVKAKGNRFHFSPLDTAADLRLDHDITILPPKKELLPTCESLLEFDISQPFDVQVKKDDRKKVLVGVHPYDMVAINMMDRIYLDTHVDEHYQARRNNTAIIASDILNIPDRAFCGSLGTHVVDTGYDLLVTDLGDTVVITVGTDKGTELLNKYTTPRDATDTEKNDVEKLRERTGSSYEREMADEYSWSEVLEENYDHPIWEENARKCLSCGSCTLVCPTCVCYDVEDEMELNLVKGKRTRTWDGCLLKDFTLVGSGETFRESPMERYRHRYYRKGLYLPKRFGFVACVGCGRCATQCLPDIADPLEVMNVLAASSMEERKELPVPDVEVQGVEEDLLLPVSATIMQKHKMNDLETLYTIKLDSGKKLEYEPGQFVEVSIFGIGEAPISISSAPGGETFELLVRRLGDLTTAIERLMPGDKVGIRGPFGNGFDTDELKGNNMLFIGGGCGLAPLRSIINYTLDNRKDFRDVTILYGCKDPDSQLFHSDLDRWEKMEDVDLFTAVDSCPDGQCWDGNTGVITTLIPMARFDPKDTKVIIVGPPIMYKFVIRDIKALGVPDENIIVSLERRMKCGVGKCGQCQINGVYVCLEGPVFNYNDIKELPEAL